MKTVLLTILTFAAAPAFANMRSCEVHERPGTQVFVDAENALMQFVSPAGEQDFVMTADAIVYFGGPRVFFDRKNECEISSSPHGDGALTVLITCQSATHRGAFEMEMSPGREAGFMMTFVTDLRDTSPGYQYHLNFENCRE